MTDGDRSAATDGPPPEPTVSHESAAVDDDPSGDEPLSRDTIYTLLKNSRRRQVLRYLREHEEASLGELAEQIAAYENDVEVDAVTSSQRKRVYIGLYQAHFPKMDDAGVIDFQKHRGTVTLLDRASQLFPYLDPHEKAEDRREVAAALAVGTLAVALAVVDVGVLAAVPDLVWTAAVWVVLVGTGLVVLVETNETAE